MDDSIMFRMLLSEPLSPLLFFISHGDGTIVYAKVFP